ncbi:glucosaminidase domain-containing protein [Candidatus Puniceispirillum sp.]|nr:glucosaminidase domain-containing protein [Candidatus Puniceispirillum sp.]
MAFLISNWVTNQNIARFALGLVFFGFIGPGLFGLSSPLYFSGKDDANPLTIETNHMPNDSNVDFEMPHASAISKANKNELDDSQNNKTSSIAVKPENKEKAVEDSSLSPVILKSQDPTTKNGPKLVSREFDSHIPESHLFLSGEAQKISFIKTALPLILAGNEEVERRRDSIERANQSDNRIALEKWANFYGIEITSKDNDQLTKKLLKRADVVPVPIALAQAAVESGWGTSRFALKGNALFGQWAWREDAGMRPLNSSNDRAVVRSFGTLFGSIRAYIHNLNTHSFYRGFRDTRAELRNQPNANKSKILVKFLDRYAEIGPAYVSKLEVLIRTNDFDQFASAQLN